MASHLKECEEGYKEKPWFICEEVQCYYATQYPGELEKHSQSHRSFKIFPTGHMERMLQYHGIQNRLEVVWKNDKLQGERRMYIYNKEGGYRGTTPVVSQVKIEGYLEPEEEFHFREIVWQYLHVFDIYDGVVSRVQKTPVDTFLAIPGYEDKQGLETCEETLYANFEAIKKRLMRARHAEIGMNEAIKHLAGRKFFTTINVVNPYQVSKDKNIVIASRSFEDHIIAFEDQLKWLSDKRFKVDWRGSIFVAHGYYWMGYIADKGGIRSSEAHKLTANKW